MFCVFRYFYCREEETSMFVWGVLKHGSPGIGTVLHWRPLNVHIFDTDPSLIKCQTS